LFIEAIMKEKVSRRSFLSQSLATGAAVGLNSAAIETSRSSRILGANDQVRLGFIGVGNRGTQLLQGFLNFKDQKVVALSDVYEPYLNRDFSSVDAATVGALGGRIPQMDEKLDKSVARYPDFRKLLEQRNIDAVVIATPDHWHAIQTIMACEAGKDVYVEKPLTMTILEGRKMIQAAERTARVIQVGLQRRSSEVYLGLPELIKRGKIGRVSVARAYRVSNMFPDGISRTQPAEVPRDLNWDMWLGPRAWRPYQSNIHPYKFRWWHEYSSQVGNWGVHYFDAMRWALDEVAPVSISAHGGRHLVDDDRTIPDTMEVTFEFASGLLMVFGQYEASGGEALPDGEIELRGTLGNLYASPAYSQAAGYRIVPSRGGQFQPGEPTINGVEYKVETHDPTLNHIRNFLDCVKSRKPCNCPLEEGHRSTSFAHLANIALETRTRIEWDPEKEEITNSTEANQLLHYSYREPWTLG
jgi:predicted dehydrogenase